MRSLSRVLMFALLLAVSAVPAFAEDEPAPAPGDAPPARPAKPDPVLPVYSIEFLMPKEDEKPEGWEIGRKAPAGAPGEDALYEIGEACQLDDDTLYVETGVLVKGDAKVGYAMLDVDEHVWAFREKLDARAAEAGWTVRELGSPARLVVAAGASAKPALDALTEHVVYTLAQLAMNRVRGRAGSEAAGREAALAYTESLQQIAQGSGVAHAIRGIVDWLRSRPTRERKEVDRAVEDTALASFDKALADGVVYPPKGSVRVFVAGQLGSILLARKDAAELKRATRALEIAVEHEKDGKDNFRRFGHRYDLACAYARAKRLDDAMAMLEKSILTGKTLPPQQWRQQFENIETKDPDLADLRGRARFKELMKEHRPEDPKNPHGNPHGKPHGGKPDGKDPHGKPDGKDPHGKDPHGGDPHGK